MSKTARRTAPPSPPPTAAAPLVLEFKEIRIGDLPRVGGKNASLGEMIRALGPKGVNVPDGFAITTDAYRLFLREAGLDERMRPLLRGLNVRDVEDLQARGRALREAILAAPLPHELEQAISGAYNRLSGGKPADVAVRSSATAEDLPDASFAGQQESYLNVRGHAMLLETVRRCFASLFTDRALSYRADKGFDHEKIALSVGVQRMVRSDLASSGVMFSIDPETGFRDAVLINAAYGLGENVVQGSVTPDEFYVFKPTLRKGFRPILQKRIGSKEFKLVYDPGGSRMVKNIPVPPDERARLALSEDEILVLARWACLIEEHYGKPMDMEWAKDGRTGELFLVQARPETVQSQKDRTVMEIHRLTTRSRVLLTGRSVGEKIGCGPVRVIKTVQRLHEFRDGEVLVTDKTDPDWEPIMKKAAAIVTNRGGRTCHAAIVSRELGLPAIVGAERATETLTDEQCVTVSCAEGETGFVYEGQLPFVTERLNLKKMPRPRTQIMMNIGNPEEAFVLSFLPNDGVGLARVEFLISSAISIHPLALLAYERLDPEEKTAADRLTAGYTDKSQFFVDKLAEGVAMIAAAFYPKDVIVRMSDFKSNEYAHLLGGRHFEPHEENPMLGFRGASRYCHPRYRDGFALECRAMKKAREEMGLTNLKLMIPFCRTVEEGRRVIGEMETHGLCRGRNGLEIYVMCEIPSNVMLAEQFAEIFDGFSIGSNDLTQLILGVDRDSEIVAPLFDERNEAVKKMIAQVIAVCRAKKRKIGICGQAPSDYPEFARFVVEQGVDSISLNPDTLLKTMRVVLETERRMAQEKIT